MCKGKQAGSCRATKEGVCVADSTGQGKRIAFLLKSLDNPFFVAMRKTVETYPLKPGYTVEIRASRSEQDAFTQVRYLESYIARGYHAVCLTPVPSPALYETLERAPKETPVIVVDTPLSKDILRKDTIGSNNSLGGQMAGEFVKRSLKDKSAEVLFLAGDLSQESALQRRDGFNKVMSEAHIKVEEKQAFWSRDLAKSIMEQLLREGKQYAAVFASNDEMVLGVVDAVNNARQPKAPRPIIVGFDCTPEAQWYLGRGDIDAIISQNPEEMAKKAMEWATSTERPAIMETPLELIVKESAGQ